MKKIIFFVCGLIISLAGLATYSNALQDEFNEHLEKLGPIAKERDEINAQIVQVNKKIYDWNYGAFFLLKDLVKDVTIETGLKVELLSKYFKISGVKINDNFIKVRVPTFFSYDTKHYSILTFVVSHVMENDSRNCPINLIEALINAGAQPGSENRRRVDTDFFSYEFAYDPHCLVKETLKEEAKANEVCKKCAQKIDDLFNEHKKKRMDKNNHD